MFGQIIFSQRSVSFLSFLFIFAVLALVYITVVSYMGATRPASPGNPLSARGGYLKRVFPTSSRPHLRVPSGRVFLSPDSKLSLLEKFGEICQAKLVVPQKI